MKDITKVSFQLVTANSVLLYFEMKYRRQLKFWTKTYNAFYVAKSWDVSWSI